MLFSERSYLIEAFKIRLSYETFFVKRRVGQKPEVSEKTAQGTIDVIHQNVSSTHR